MRSEDRVFAVCKYAIHGEWFYEAWRGAEMIATRLPSFDAAKAACVLEPEAA